MSKPAIHARSSVKKWGGVEEDYLPIHDWFDASKETFADNRHRALRHHTQGIFEAERTFGHEIVNSAGKRVSVRDIGEQHCLEDFGGFIPTLGDYLAEMEPVPWMSGRGEPPPSAIRIANRRKSGRRESVMVD